MIRYPSPDEYMKAVQHPESFTAAELRGLALVTHPVYGIPMPAAGTSAVVFKAVAGGEPQALRFFTRDDAWSGERYDALHEHFTSSDLAGAVALPRWVDHGIRVNGRTWPVVRMQWVDGHTLNRHVEDLVERGDTTSLAALARSWRDLVTRIQRAGFAHGDLQHGNVLVDGRGALRLVDFDCSWIAPFAGTPAPGETGHRNYQPELRPWGRWMDTFPALVIYLSLLAAAGNLTGWRTLYTGENLLFRHEDFRSPFDTAAWAHVAGIHDDHLDEVAQRLKECCAPGWTATAGLDDLLSPRATPWWERTPTVITPSAITPSGPTPAPAPLPVPVSVPAPRAPITTPRSAEWWTVPTAGPAAKPPNAGAALAIALAIGVVTAGVAAIGLGPVAGVLLGGVAALIAFVVALAGRNRSG